MSPSPVVFPLLAAAVLMASTGVTAVIVELSLAGQIAIYLVAGLASFIVLHRVLLGLLAGLALAVIRPYASGERVRLHSPAHGGEVEAVIARIGPVNTTLAMDGCQLFVPNYLLLKGAPAVAEKSMQA